MKTLSTFILLTFFLTTSAFASYNSHNRYHGSHNRHYATQHYEHRSHTNWIAPLVFTGVLGYALASSQNRTVTYVQTPQSCPSTPTYQEQWVYFEDCDCQRKVLMRVR
jgi:hypothetical protein